ncbi:ECF RNA polymerase sigma factor SigK [subsurface metagenome]|jgi:RNA polymerase sigma-70 factor (ECF subfamily)|nr:MAG: sigma-70 family RNA polymerase sigma factor [Bradyrhizobium icense]
MRRTIRGDRDKDGLATLLGEIAAGDKSAFARLYGLTNRKLFGVALRILHSREAAEDIVQEVYVRIWRNAASFDVNLASPIAWMASIVRHCAIDTLRKQKLETVEYGEETTRVEAYEPDPAEEIDMAQRRAIAFAAIRKMEPAKRDLILLAYVREQSRDSLAKVFSVPTGTIKTNLRRSLIELRQSMQLDADRTRSPTARTFEAA